MGSGWHMKMCDFAPGAVLNSLALSLCLFSILFCLIEHTCQKLCFYGENVDIWPFKAHFISLLERAPKLIKKDTFQSYFPFHFKGYVHNDGLNSNARTPLNQ